MKYSSSSINSSVMVQLGNASLFALSRTLEVANIIVMSATVGQTCQHMQLNRLHCNGNSA